MLILEALGICLFRDIGNNNSSMVMVLLKLTFESGAKKEKEKTGPTVPC